MRSPRDFFKPLASALRIRSREIPFPPSRMIHFFDASNEKMVAKLPAIAREGGHRPGQPRGRRPGRPQGGRARRPGQRRQGPMELGETQLWTRVNALDSPWVLDDLTTLVSEIGDKLDVIMVPKVEGPWDIHYVDRLLAQLEARAGVEKPILVHAILETAPGRRQPRGDRRRLPAHAGHELRPGRPRRLAAHEDDARRRRPPRLPHDRGPGSEQPGRPARQRPAGPVALLDRAHGRRLHDARDPPVLRAVRRHQGHRRLRGAVPLRVPAGLRRRLVAAPGADRHRQEGLLARPGRGQVRQEGHRGDPGRPRRPHDRRQDAGRRDLEAVQGHGRPRRACSPRRTRSWPRPTASSPPPPSHGATP